jgi:hypothetical protein
MLSESINEQLVAESITLPHLIDTNFEDVSLKKWTNESGSSPIYVRYLQNFFPYLALKKMDK